MNLTLYQFEIMVRIERHQDRKHSQRELAKQLNVSLGVINKTLNELLDMELIRLKDKSCYDVTLKGYAHDLKTVYEQPGGRERYWEQTPLVFCREHYQVAVRPCRDEDVTEIDTLRELKAFDRSYDIGS